MKKTIVSLTLLSFCFFSTNKALCLEDQNWPMAWFGFSNKEVKTLEKKFNQLENQYEKDVTKLNEMAFQNQKEIDLLKREVEFLKNQYNFLQIQIERYKEFEQIVFQSNLSFSNCLLKVAYELPLNFCHRGNFDNPFITTALKKLIYEEPMVSEDPLLLEKAIKCLNVAEALSNASPYHPKLKPADGQFLMRDLADYIFNKYGIGIPHNENY